MPGALIPHAGDDSYNASLSSVNIEFAYPGALWPDGTSGRSWLGHVQGG